jgi:hypothetical protein
MRQQARCSARRVHRFDDASDMVLSTLRSQVEAIGDIHGYADVLNVQLGQPEQEMRAREKAHLTH